MQIIKNEEILDLKENQIEIDNTSPIFNMKGTQSVSMNFPKTPKNLRLFGFPNRLDRYNKVSGDEQVEVRDGVLIKSGIMNVTAVGENIEANIGFGESEAYSKMNKTKLADMTGLPVFYPPLPSTGISHILSMLKGILIDRARFDESDFGIFPVVTSFEKNGDTGMRENLMILNELKKSDQTVFVGEKKRTISVKVDSEYKDIKVPIGYGISPFLKLHVLLQLVWKYLGFNLIENPFREDFQLSSICVLNNTWDTIVAGKIRYSDLMPDCTIEDILSMVWGKFGAVYFVDSNTKNVRIKLIKDILQSPESEDYSLFKSGNPEIGVSKGKQLKFSCNKSGDLTETSKKTYSEFLKSCGGIITSLSAWDLFDPSLPISKYIYVYVKETGQFFYNAIYGDGFHLISSSFFEWNLEIENLEYEEIKSPDNALPILSAITQYNPAPYLDAGELNLNTSLHVSADKKTESEREERAPLSICFALHNGGSCFGSIFSFEPRSGNRVNINGNEFSLDLVYQGSSGLVMNFFRDYMDFMRHANQEITQPLILPKITLYNLDFSRKLLIDGQFFLPESFTQIVGKSKDSAIDMKLRSLTLLQPYDSNEYEPVDPTPQLYYWKEVNYAEDEIERYRLILENDPDYENVEVYSVSYTTSPSEDDFAYLTAPTIEDYNNAVEHLERYKVFITYRYFRISDQRTILEYYDTEYKAGVKVALI